ncbi:MULTISPECIES: WbqC family protein [unclassified Janthinobacterium]|uniref:WbqC family protein n=1 Tax=unclassified Janthinobacterium TaxID=2610881 RepID=UPI00088A918E|nr:MULTISPECIES: WbqC family protein [unclassified Janthinobacterium]SDA81077.1 WbqC-like protein family protein [Janthinobacterium sp. 551a]SFB65448.1 WbqC-like protein family protein [Janthinobacterium sp. 344]
MKTIAIMQPYFLPYLGYFQLLAAVDKFVLLDDVNYIRGGWINRNRMLMNGAPHLFTLPLQGASQNRRICDIALTEETAWRDKLLRSINQAYGRAPYYAHVIGLLEQTLHSPHPQLDQFLLNSLRQAMRYLGLETELVPTARAYANDELSGDRRIIDICVREGATRYINPIGGTSLYRQEDFQQHGIALHFLQSRPTSYHQGKHPHVAGLSIIDVMMNNAPATIKQLLMEKDLL